MGFSFAPISATQVSSSRPSKSLYDLWEQDLHKKLQSKVFVHRYDVITHQVISYVLISSILSHQVSIRKEFMLLRIQSTKMGMIFLVFLVLMGMTDFLSFAVWLKQKY